MPSRPPTTLPTTGQRLRRWLNRPLRPFAAARRAALLLPLALAVTACTIQFGTVVQPDGAGEWRTEIGLNLIDQQMLDQLGTPVEDFCQDLPLEDELPEGVAVRVEQRGTEQWCVLSRPYADLAELEALYADSGFVTVNALGFTDDAFVYDVEIAFADLGDFEVGVTPDVRWQVTLPGPVRDHNADERSGTTLTWELPLTGAVQAQATSDRTGGGRGASGVAGALPIITAIVAGLCCCGLLVLALAAGAFALQRRRQAAVPPPPPAPSV